MNRRSFPLAVVVALASALPNEALAQTVVPAPEFRPGLPSSDPNGDPVAPLPPGDRIDAGFGQGVAFHSEENDLRLQLRGRIQPRFASVTTGAEPTINEFVIRRARLMFLGRFKESWELYLQLGFSDQDNEPDNYNPLRDATITYGGVRDAMVRFGQMKVPFDRQRTTSSSALQFADRSLVMSELTLDRDVGVQMLSEDLGGLGGLLGYNLGVFGGDGRNRRANNPGLMVVGRVWTSPFGPFDPYVEADIKRDSRFRLALGVAGAKNFESVRERSTSSGTYDFASFDFTHLTADLTMKWRGFSCLSEMLYRKADQPSQTAVVTGASVTEYSRSGWGFFIQAGYMWTAHFETAARYGELFPLGQTDPTLQRQRELGGAVSYYLDGHNLKLTVDYFYMPVLPDGLTTQQLRVQSQLYF